MKETKFLAPILLESPLMFEILEKIRDKYSKDKPDLTKTRISDEFCSWFQVRPRHRPRIHDYRCRAPCIIALRDLSRLALTGVGAISHPYASKKQSPQHQAGGSWVRG